MLSIRYFIKILIFFLFIFLIFWIFYLNKKNQIDIKVPEVNRNFERIRKPAVSGTFYPSKKEDLEKQISIFLNNAENFEIKEKIRILITPHAGLSYSGQVAAYGYKQLKDNNYSKVILLGSSHKRSFNFIAIDDNDYWETPLGKVELDKDLIKSLVNNDSVKLDSSPHSEEHSLEIELIFLQSVLNDFKITPILIGQVDEYFLMMLAQKLSYNFDENTLLVVSSDLSHYPKYEDANNIDYKTINSILDGDVEKFKHTLKEINESSYNGLVTTACAKDAIETALEIGNILGIKNYKNLIYKNSGDVTNDKNRVVGYVSIVGYSDFLEKFTIRVNQQDKIKILKLARNTLESFLSKGELENYKEDSHLLNTPMGVFVTLKKNGYLRGCIGEFEPTKPMYKVIQETAISSATKDQRFKPLTYDELKDIDIEISIMTPRKKVKDWKNIRLGIDGVVVKKGFNAGTFLPQVAEEFDWNLDEYLSQLCHQKANLDKECYKDSSVDIFSFEVLSFSEKDSNF